MTTSSTLTTLQKVAEAHQRSLEALRTGDLRAFRSDMTMADELLTALKKASEQEPYKALVEEWLGKSEPPAPQTAWVPKVGDRVKFKYKSPDIEDNPSTVIEVGGDYVRLDNKGCYGLTAFEPYVWQLPPLPSGMSYHREDGWTEEMLPEGYRPLLLNETVLSGDQYFSNSRWNDFVFQKGSITVGKEYTGRIRTTRPLPSPTPEPKPERWSPDIFPLWNGKCQCGADFKGSNFAMETIEGSYARCLACKKVYRTDNPTDEKWAYKSECPACGATDRTADTICKHPWHGLPPQQPSGDVGEKTELPLSCGPASGLDNATLVTVALESAGRLSRYNNEIQFNRVKECREELLKRLTAKPLVESGVQMEKTGLWEVIRNTIPNPQESKEGCIHSYLIDAYRQLFICDYNEASAFADEACKNVAQAVLNWQAKQEGEGVARLRAYINGMTMTDDVKVIHEQCQKALSIRVADAWNDPEIKLMERDLAKLEKDRDHWKQRATAAEEALVESKAQVDEQMAIASKAEGALAEAERWKAEALIVMEPIQEIGKELGIGLGQSIHDKILPGIVKLKKELNDAKIELQAIVSAQRREVLDLASERSARVKAEQERDAAREELRKAVGKFKPGDKVKLLVDDSIGTVCPVNNPKVLVRWHENGPLMAYSEASLELVQSAEPAPTPSKPHPKVVTEEEMREGFADMWHREVIQKNDGTLERIEAIAPGSVNFAREIGREAWSSAVTWTLERMGGITSEPKES